MTIGFGDFVPGNSYIYKVADNMSEKEAQAKLVLATIYLLLGMGIIAMCVNLMQEKIFTQVCQYISFEYLFITSDTPSGPHPWSTERVWGCR